MATSDTREDGRLVTLELGGLGRLGEAMADLDGKPVYVFGGIPGETVVVEVIRERRGYIAAQVVEVVTPSEHRVEPPCGYFGACTGCQWQHISYERQLEIKREIVVDALDRIGGLDGVVTQLTLPSPERPRLPQPRPLHRGTARLAGGGAIGLCAPRAPSSR